MTDVFESLIEAIQDGVKTQEIVMEGVPYFDRKVELPPPEPRVEALKVHTLSGLVTYLQDDKDGIVEGIVQVHIVDPTTVKVVGVPSGRHRLREIHMVCDCAPIIGKSFRFGEFLKTEDFVIGLLSQFEPDNDRAKILQLVGNIRDENVKTIGDDGTTQQVSVRTGIAKLENVAVPNPVTLRPYRSFPEIRQPPVDFVLRLRSGAKDGEMPTAALFESSGGMWKLEAIQRIHDYLAGALPETITILA